MFSAIFHSKSFFNFFVEYCNSMASPDVSTSPYLKALGAKLDPMISVMWTGKHAILKKSENYLLLIFFLLKSENTISCCYFFQFFLDMIFVFKCV